MGASSLCLAMVKYDTFAQWMTGLENIKHLLVLGAVVSFIVVGLGTLLGSSRRDTLFCGRFAAGFLPVALCIAAAIVELERLSWDWRRYHRSLSEADFVYFVIFGAVLSAIATAIYLVKRREET